MYPDPGGPKTYGSDGSGSDTLALSYIKNGVLEKKDEFTTLVPTRNEVCGMVVDDVVLQI
jgi:hypothetical protein